MEWHGMEWKETVEIWLWKQNRQYAVDIPLLITRQQTGSTSEKRFLGSIRKRRSSRKECFLQRSRAKVFITKISMIDHGGNKSNMTATINKHIPVHSCLRNTSWWSRKLFLIVFRLLLCWVLDSALGLTKSRCHSRWLYKVTQVPMWKEAREWLTVVGWACCLWSEVVWFDSRNYLLKQLMGSTPTLLIAVPHVIAWCARNS